MASLDFPTIDISGFEATSRSGKRELGLQVDAVCRSTGFLAISHHGVPQQTIDAAWNGARAFFDLPFETKLASRPPRPGYPYGYLAPQAEALAKSRGVDSPPDLKESFNSGPLEKPHGLDDPGALEFCYVDNIWPAEPAGFAAAWQAYYRAMGALAARLMRIFAVALDLGEDFFNAAIATPISALRALNYPRQAVPAAAGQLRAGAHTDYGSLTILLPEAGAEGLQIFTPDGEWHDVPAVPGTFVVNIGDLMARWTNDRWVSTLHRVVNPPPGRASTRRQSMAFFNQPNWQAEIACLPSCLAPGETPKYPPVLSGPYLMSKFTSTVGAA